MEGFLAYDCDDNLAARLRREIDEARGAGYDCFEFNTFDVELFYGENRVKITEVAALGYADMPRRSSIGANACVRTATVLARGWARTVTRTASVRGPW
jgi:hypothetical protein